MKRTRSLQSALLNSCDSFTMSANQKRRFLFYPFMSFFSYPASQLGREVYVLLLEKIPSVPPGLPHDMVLGSYGNLANTFSSQCLIFKLMPCWAQLSAFSISEALRGSPSMVMGGRMFNRGKIRRKFFDIYKISLLYCWSDSCVQKTSAAVQK